MSKVFEAEMDRRARENIANWNYENDRPFARQSEPQAGDPNEPAQAPTDRPVDMPPEAPPHEAIPEGPEPAGAPTPVEHPDTQPPPVPAAELAQQIHDTAVANVYAAARARIAFMSMLAAFEVQVHYVYSALGELKPEDYESFPRTLTNIITGIDLLQARIANLERDLHPIRQAAE
ncbi:MAG: hypothetical protein K2X43_01135 [Hyphomonadaceae bacterium]|jgi:hypothetical protein|nr:hypothetical protein [Hyphomonadaceae bacterium]